MAVVIAGPSGAGKSSVIAELLRRDPTLVFSVSATTRPPRPDERDGRDYRFVSDAEFDRMIRLGELLEWTTYGGHRYGTPRSEVEDRLRRGQDVIVNVEVQGALALRRAGLPQPVVLVFLVPPTREDLVRRIRARGTEAEEAVAARLRRAEEEVQHIPEFDYLVVNEELGLAVDRVEAIIVAERARIRKCSP